MKKQAKADILFAKCGQDYFIGLWSLNQFRGNGQTNFFHSQSVSCVLPPSERARGEGDLANGSSRVKMPCCLAWFGSWWRYSSSSTGDKCSIVIRGHQPLSMKATVGQGDTSCRLRQATHGPTIYVNWLQHQQWELVLGKWKYKQRRATVTKTKDQIYRFQHKWLDEAFEIPALCTILRGHIYKSIALL